MSGKIKKLILYIAAVLLVYFFLYGYIASSHNYKESRDHLLEIYSQMDNSYSMLVSQNWKMLDDWGHMIARQNQEDIIRSFVSKEKNNWEFADFYFLDSSGSYVTVDGVAGNMNCPQFQDISENFNDTNFMGHVFIDGEDMVLFAITTDSGVYESFGYTGIGITYKREAVDKLVDVSAFHEESECYLVYPDGNIMFSAKFNEWDSGNLVTRMLDNGRFRGVEEEEFREKIRGNSPSLELYEVDGIEYYVACQPLSFQKGTILGIVPKSVINSNMKQVRWISIMIAVLALSPIIIGILYYFVSWSKERFREKDMEIHEREVLFQILTDQTDDIYIIFSSKDYRAQYVSPNIERVFGISVAQIQDDVRNLMVMTADDKITLTGTQLELIDIGEYWETSRSLVHQKTKERKCYKEMLYHVSDSKTSDYIMQLSDRTRERNIAEQLENALGMAKSASEAKTTFLSNMSHDLRTPMNAIVGIATLLSKEADHPDKVREYAKKITASSNVLFGLINDILDMSKIENGKITLASDLFSMEELVEGVSVIVLPQAKAKQQQFEVYTDGIPEEAFIGDRLRLQQILLNLLSNAVKYTPEHGKFDLTITVPEYTGEYQLVRFTVHDNGIGMTKEFQQNIFEPFERMEDSSRTIQGTGLGMAIVKNLVDIMGGTITVDSTLGVGSTFTVELVLRTKKSQADPDFWKNYQISRILLIDDEEVVCRSVQVMMEDTGVLVEYTTDSREADALVEREAEAGTPYDLVLVDWKMPHQDGIETSRRIRESAGNQLPILILTAFDWEGIEKEARSVGVDGFLSKPFLVSAFKNSIVCMKESELVGTDQEEEDLSIAGLHFLVVEDYEINRDILMELLQMEGATSEAAVNGAEGAEMFENSKEGHFDMILMDVQMPVLNGYEATRRIRSGSHPQSSTIPIIAMTANAFEEDVTKSLESGMNEHVAKPIDMKVFKRAVNRLRGRTS